MAKDNRAPNPQNSDPTHEQLLTTTPYSRTQEQVNNMLQAIIKNPLYRYIDSGTNPSIGSDTSIFRVDSTDANADVGRTLEAAVFSRDAGYTKEFIEEQFSPYDQNSIFLLLVKETAIGSQLAGVFRVIDCTKGESETINFYKEFYGEELPLELSAGNHGEKVWDLMSVAIDPRYRDGTNSAWLYHALYRMSLEGNVDRWISNITPKEIRNLRERLGIPLANIPGVKPAIDVTPDGSKAEYGFYSVKVKDIGPGVAQRISDLESKVRSDDASEKEKRLGTVLSRVARIALNGESH